VVAVILPDSIQGDLAIRYAYGLTASEVERGRYARDAGVTGRAMQRGGTVIAQDIETGPQYLAGAVRRSMLPHEVVSFIARPIAIDGRVAGVLGVHRIRQRKRALADDMRILKFIAKLVGQVVKLKRPIEDSTALLEQEERTLFAPI
jgi:Nif-specific regulatory protein